MTQDNKTIAVRTGVQFIEVDEDSVGQRLDNFLFRLFRGVPKSRIYKALRSGEVRVNKKRAKQDYRLKLSDLVRVPPMEQVEKARKPVADKWLDLVEKSILFENKDLIVVNKPSGLAVHGGSGIDYGLIEAVRKIRPDCKRLELAHRLDRDTSGCTLITKKSSVLKAFHQQLREKTVDKRYLALVAGKWPRRKTYVDQKLAKNVLKSGERMVSVSAEGKPSRTNFSIVENFPGATLVEARPLTGRTHQIRVHAQFAGFPLLGDDKYSRKPDLQFAREIGLQRLFLHASELSFRLPGETGDLTIKAPLPDELEATLALLRERRV